MNIRQSDDAKFVSISQSLGNQHRVIAQCSKDEDDMTPVMIYVLGSSDSYGIHMNLEDLKNIRDMLTAILDDVAKQTKAAGGP